MILKSGYSRMLITPEKSMYLAGYDKREQKSMGVHDELYASCLIFQCAGKKLVLISMDILGVDEILNYKIKKAISDFDKSIGMGCIFVFATHTHSGPSTVFYGRKTYDEEYCDFIASRCRDAFIMAMGDAKDSVILSNTMNIYGIASKRNIHKIEENDEGIKCTILKIKRNGYNTMLINFPCHMTVLNENNLLYSKDMVYGLQDALCKRGMFNLLYANGAAGDISTRFYRKDASFAEVNRLGAIFADQILSACDYNKLSADDILFKKTGFLLKYKRNLTDSEKDAKRDEIKRHISKIGDMRLKRDMESALLILNRPDKNFDNIFGIVKMGNDYFKKVEIQYALMGRIAFIGIPFEIYYSTGERIKDILKMKYGCDTVFLLGYCGGYFGYLPPESDFSSICYETIACPFEKDGEGKLFSAVENL